MSQSKHDVLREGLALVFEGIALMKSAFDHRHFTIDGRLVGDIGEVIAELEYDLTLDQVSQPHYDATTSDGRRVQIKATFKDSLTFKSTPDYLIGLKLYEDGSYEEVFNGPGKLINEKYSHRSGLGKSLLSFPNTTLIELSRAVTSVERIPKRGS